VAFDVGHKAGAAGIVFEAWIVEAPLGNLFAGRLPRRLLYFFAPS